MTVPFPLSSEFTNLNGVSSKNHATVLGTSVTVIEMKVYNIYHRPRMGYITFGKVAILRRLQDNHEGQRNYTADRPAKLVYSIPPCWGGYIL